MGIKELMLDTESERGRWVYTKILKLLDSPNRKIFDNPEKLIKASGIMEGQTVLEIGCGSGYFTAEISKILGSSGKLFYRHTSSSYRRNPKKG
jgi:ubiquinone/menaquinone biosynthesis C-methylase UbiE